jgi:ubiquinone/menaquinone biosynthesis C-methylase UbiE
MERVDTYTHGHHESVLRSHRWRTAENSAGYLLPYLEEGNDVLDVGCGPGTITVGLAKHVRPGRVLGIDRASDVLMKASELAEASDVDNVLFEQANVYNLPYARGAFDVVHAHQVLQHLSDPIAALKEMARVTRHGGLIAVRDADYAAMSWYPANAGLERWQELYHRVTKKNNAEADAGRRLLAWAREAGFEDITATSATWTYADDDARTWWSNLWADRLEQSSLGRQILAGGFGTETDITEVAQAWRDWGQEEDGWFVVVHGELIIRM